MPKRVTINSLIEFIKEIDTIPILERPIMLYRGQSVDRPLLPGVARKNANNYTRNSEKEVLEDFERRAKLLLSGTSTNEWDLLVYAQHFGLKTRLLDWTSNPLIALWFACYDISHFENDSYVYKLWTDDQDFADTTKSPFDNRYTRIFRPMLNNARIVAQSGWFTVHNSTATGFTPLEKNNRFKNKITVITIPSTIKEKLLSSLSKMGINHSSIYPDLTGLCDHLNYKYNL